jgi:hypothetical protein
LIFSVILLPLLTGASIIVTPEEDDIVDDDLSLLSHFSVAWIRIPVHQLSVLLRAELSIFTLFVVYLGGRSKHRRFNDRTIDHVRVLMAEYLKTARIRAVFKFNFIPLRGWLITDTRWVFIFYPSSQEKE